MAATTYEFHVDAEREIEETVAVIEDARRGSGRRYLAAIQKTVRMCMEYPDIGRKARRHQRAFSMTDWPYKIVYSLEGDTIFVWAVAHDSRKPGYWRKRTR